MDKYIWLDQMLKKYCVDVTEKQVSILKSAIILFSEKGYASTSTKEIAQMAGVSEGSIFKNYSTKKDLMLYIIEMIINEMLVSLVTTGLDEITSKYYETTEDLLVDIMKNRLSLLSQGIPIYKIILQEIPFQPEIRKIMFKKINEVTIPDLLQNIRKRGLLVDLPDQTIITIIITCISGYINTRYVLFPELFCDNSKFDLKDDLNSFIQFMVRGLTVRQHEGLELEGGEL